MTRTPALALACLLALSLALSGCFSLSREATLQRHFVLGGVGEGRVAAPEGSGSGASIGLRPPRVADYLATPFLVVRHGPQQIHFSDTDRWGEELARGVNRALAGYIAEKAPSARVETAPWAPGVQPEFLIQLHLLRFEGVMPADAGNPTGEAHLLATWEVLRREDGALLAHGTTEVREGGWRTGDYQALASLLDRTLLRLAQDLLAALERSI